MKFIKSCLRYSLTSLNWQRPRLLGVLQYFPVSTRVLDSPFRCMTSVAGGGIGGSNLLRSALSNNTTTSCKYHTHEVDENHKEREFVSMKAMPDHIVIKFRDGDEMKTSGIWLRDHCRCDKCFDESRYQNLFDPCSLSNRPLISGVVQNEKEICIEWNDGHRSTYDIGWLLSSLANKSPRYLNRQLWNVDKLESANISNVSYKEYMNETDALAEFLRNVYTYGLAFVTDVPVTKEDLIALSERISFLRECEHGKYDIVISSKEKKFDDIAFTNLSLGFHTDSAYSVEPLGYLMFHLMEHTGEGGLGRYVDGFHVAELMRQHHPDCYRILSEVLVTQEFIDKGVHYKGSYPIFTIIDNEVKIIRYQTTDRVFTQHLSLEETELFYDALNLLYKYIYSPENEYWLKYHPGRVVLFDNFRLLHGRSIFTGTRVLRNTVLPRDEVDSRIRVLTGLG